MMISRKQILEQAEKGPSTLKMFQIMCNEVILERGDMRINSNLVRMYAEDYLKELGEEE